MAGSNITARRLRNGDYTMIRFEEVRGDKALRTLWIKAEPGPQDLLRLEAFLNGRKCNCAKNRH